MIKKIKIGSLLMLGALVITIIIGLMWPTNENNVKVTVRRSDSIIEEKSNIQVTKDKKEAEKEKRKKEYRSEQTNVVGLFDIKVDESKKEPKSVSDIYNISEETSDQKEVSKTPIAKIPDSKPVSSRRDVRKPTSKKTQKPVEESQILYAEQMGTSLGGSPNEISNNDLGEGSNKQLARAVIYDNRRVKTGDAIEFRLLERLVINGNEIKKNTFITGYVTSVGIRLSIKITEINGVYGNYNVYDLRDKKEGLMLSKNENTTEVKAETINDVGQALGGVVPGGRLVESLIRQSTGLMSEKEEKAVNIYQGMEVEIGI